MIHVVAVITTKPGKRAEFLAAYHANVTLVQAEGGCIEYGPMIDVSFSPNPLGDDTFIVIGKWENEDHLKAHMTAAHMPAFWVKTKDWVESRSVHFVRSPYENCQSTLRM